MRWDHQPLTDGKKHCSACRESLPASVFPKRKQSPDGLNPKCRPCLNAARRQSYRNCIDHRRAKSREYSATARERRGPQLVAATREWRKIPENHARCLASHREWTKQNAERVNAYARARRVTLPDDYVRHCVRYSDGKKMPGPVPQELVELKRVQIQLRRLTKNPNENHQLQGTP